MKTSGYTTLTDNWMDFLRDSMNKKELCYSHAWTAHLATSHRCVCHNRASCDQFPLVKASPYKTVIMRRIVVHVLHALKQGKQTIYMHTVDTDVVIVAGMIWCNSTFGRHLSGLWHEQG